MPPEKALIKTQAEYLVFLKQLSDFFTFSNKKPSFFKKTYTDKQLTNMAHLLPNTASNVF